MAIKTPCKHLPTALGDKFCEIMGKLQGKSVPHGIARSVGARQASRSNGAIAPTSNRPDRHRCGRTGSQSVSQSLSYKRSIQAARKQLRYAGRRLDDTRLHPYSTRHVSTPQPTNVQKSRNLLSSSRDVRAPFTIAVSVSPTRAALQTFRDI